jgi:class 3 adenylate cyclase/tetratricopeptide (TPR) repeat protein
VVVCPSCGVDVPEGARFCPSCGFALVTVNLEERRIVTVLFADIVGFTALAEHRDPERVKRLVDAAFERLVADVEVFGGRVDKLLGDAVVAMFGAPIAHEDDAERAVRAGLQMHETLRAFACERPNDAADMQLRVGINTGEVLVGTLLGTDYTAMGDVVNMASRLQSLASPGAVLVGDATRELCSEAIRFEAVAPVQLRGREQIETMWLAVGTEAPAGNRRRRREVPFIGRVVERTLLDAVTRHVGAGRGAVVSIVGEAGIGKSRLVDEIVAEFTASAPNVAVFDGACAPYGEANVWWPLASAIGGRFGIRSGASADDVRASALAKIGSIPGVHVESPEVRRQIEALLHMLGHPSELDRLDAAGARDALFDTVIAMLRRRAAVGPIVLWIDDLQWSHGPLRDLLEVIARSLTDCPMLVITAHRPGHDLEWPPAVERAFSVQLPLGPLDQHESAVLVGEIVGTSSTPDLVQRLYERSGGNPLFLSELALLATSGDADGQELPGSLRALIAARLDQLTPAGRAIIDNAAVLGTESFVGALEEFAEALGQRFDHADLDELVADGLLEIEGTWWRFRSDVVREVAYQTLTKQARAQRHAGVATVMAGHPKSPVEGRAHHAATAAELLAELGSVPGVPRAIRTQAIELLGEAVDTSYAVGAFRRGVTFSRRALALVGDDQQARVPMLVRHATGLVELRTLDEARAVLAELLELATQEADPVAEGEAWRLMGSVDQLEGDLVNAREKLGRAVEIFRGLDDDAHLALALRARGFAEVLGGSLPEAGWYLGEADGIYERLGDIRGRAWVEQNKAWVAFLSGDTAAAERQLDHCIGAFEEIGDQLGANLARGLLAFVRYFERRFDEAEALAQEVAVEARRWGDDWGYAMMQVLGANLRLWTGRLAESAQFAERALTLFRKLGDRFGIIQAMAPLNRARVALGRVADAERGVEEVLALSDAFGGLAFPTIAASGVEMHLGNGERAVELARQSVERMESTGVDVDESKVILALGLCQADQAEDGLATLLDVDVAVSPFALAARAVANAMLGEDAAAMADADAADAIAGISYFDRTLAAVAGAAAATRSGTADCEERMERMAALAETCGDVVMAALARTVAHRLGTADVADPPALGTGWRTVAERITGPPR